MSVGSRTSDGAAPLAVGSMLVMRLQCAAEATCEEAKSLPVPASAICADPSAGFERQRTCSHAA
jgi:hypothetical protein